MDTELSQKVASHKSKLSSFDTEIQKKVEVLQILDKQIALKEQELKKDPPIEIEEEGKIYRLSQWDIDTPIVLTGYRHQRLINTYTKFVLVTDITEEK
tara:strand:- start:195 stop:488 length:294 start_codon:yes stop_codon:yes gene_type:complete